ncbi:hypothetical protein DNTS_004579 [Danionella cerebrum]|uniref:SH3 domain-containing protein n=1 Tax=Danionella cerebrum TaxID=2873325 RepID=A0A553QGP5_9TELE|nr:hypothetical protein DNTS_004579 [Danionella translucida]
MTALFAYEGLTNNLKLADSGAGGLTELVGKFHSNRSLYGLCRLGLTETGQPQIVMVCWVGDAVDETRRDECASHVPAVKNFFKQDEVTEELIMNAVTKVPPPVERPRRASRSTEKEETVGTNYKKTNAAMEMRWINRDSFWARAEREEEARKEEERRRALEDRRRWERERVLQERKEAEERDRKMNEKLQMIEEQRRIQAQLEEEARKEEKARWMQQQREHEEDMRARLRRSESIEKAAEAAALVSQRTFNAREFFRQLSASSQNSSSPGSPRAGKSPFRRYQRSLTDTAFIFERMNSSSGPTSPLSPSARSPFSRSPSTATSYKSPSSPLSPTHRMMASPQDALSSPPSSPPSRTLTSHLLSNRPPAPNREPPHAPSHVPAPPVSPDFQDSLKTYVWEVNNAAEACAAPLSDHSVNSTEVLTCPQMLRSSEAEVDFVVRAVLVEEDEDEEPQESTCTAGSPSDKQTHQELVQSKEEEPEAVEEGDVNHLPKAEEEGSADQEEMLAAESEEIQTNFENLPAAEENEVVSEDEAEEDVPENQELCVSEDEDELMTEGEDVGCVTPLNGTEHSTPERYCYTVNREEEDEIQREIVMKNGESSPETLLRVRALYDYQAEDETELSFEPGDIICDVETVDKAWWRGFGKDGRQGLFPANFVETI